MKNRCDLIESILVLKEQASYTILIQAIKYEEKFNAA